MAKISQDRKKTFTQIQQEWEKIQSLDTREKLKAMRTISHDITVSYEKSEVSLEHIELYMKIMKQAVQTRSFPQKTSRFLAKLIADWLVFTGNDKATIMLKSNAKIPVESGCIIVADPTHFNIDELKNDYSDKNYLHLMNQGKFFLFSTGADGVYDIQLRVVDSLEPVLTAKEFNCVEDTSEPAVIHISTGNVAVADPFFLNSEKRLMLTPIPPGNYKICVYLFRMSKKLESFYIALAKTESVANNHFTKIYQFEN